MAKTKAKAETEDRSSLHRQAYGAATRRLREAHRAEFNALMQEEAKTTITATFSLLTTRDNQ